jgi:hypothetical protein
LPPVTGISIGVDSAGGAKVGISVLVPVAVGASVAWLVFVAVPVRVAMNCVIDAVRDGSTCIGVFVFVAVGGSVCVLVAVRVFVAVRVAVAVFVRVGMTISVAVLVAVAVFVAVFVPVAVAVFVEVPVGCNVAVSVAVGVKVGSHSTAAAMTLIPFVRKRSRPVTKQISLRSLILPPGVVGVDNASNIRIHQIHLLTIQYQRERTYLFDIHIDYS